MTETDMRTENAALKQRALDWERKCRAYAQEAAELRSQRDNLMGQIDRQIVNCNELKIKVATARDSLNAADFPWHEEVEDLASALELACKMLGVKF